MGQLTSVLERVSVGWVGLSAAALAGFKIFAVSGYDPTVTGELIAADGLTTALAAFSFSLNVLFWALLAAVGGSYAGAYFVDRHGHRFGLTKTRYELVVGLGLGTTFVVLLLTDGSLWSFVPGSLTLMVWVARRPFPVASVLQVLLGVLVGTALVIAQRIEDPWLTHEYLVVAEAEIPELVRDAWSVTLPIPEAESVLLEGFVIEDDGPWITVLTWDERVLVRVPTSAVSFRMTHMEILERWRSPPNWVHQ